MTHDYAVLYSQMLLEQNARLDFFQVSMDSRGSMDAVALALTELGCTVHAEGDLNMIVYMPDHALPVEPYDISC